jgi:alpha-D-ribose 1-methylphosphonate 5-triphosphate diphosphatase
MHHGAICLDGDVLKHVERESIAEFDPNGVYILPGLIDVHAAALEHEIMPRPGARIPMSSAFLAHDACLACAGATTALTALTLRRIPGAPSAIDQFLLAIETAAQASAAGVLRIRHMFHLRCELADEGTVEDAERILESYPRAVALIAAMNHSEGQRQFKTREHWESAFLKETGYDHGRLEELRQSRRHGSKHHYLERLGRLAELAKRFGIAFASHDDDTREDVARAAALGATMSEFPVSEEAAAAARDAGMSVAVGAPNLLRGGSYLGNISSARLIDLGAANILTSDYAPASLVPALFKLPQRTDDRRYGLHSAVRLATSAPAAALDLPYRGDLAPGTSADFIRVRAWDGTASVAETWVAGRRVA